MAYKVTDIEGITMQQSLEPLQFLLPMICLHKAVQKKEEQPLLK